MEKKIKHLDMIQAIVTRMGANSFMLKGWSVTLMAGIFALVSKGTNKSYFAISFIPILIFGFLILTIYIKKDFIKTYIMKLG